MRGLALEPPNKAVKSPLRGPRGPCPVGEKPLYQPQLMVLIRSRIESGPPGTRSFLLPERAGEVRPPCPARAARPDGVQGPTQRKLHRRPDRPKASFDTGY